MAVLVECIFLIFGFLGHICTKMRWLVCAVLLASMGAQGEVMTTCTLIEDLRIPDEVTSLRLTVLGLNLEFISK